MTARACWPGRQEGTEDGRVGIASIHACPVSDPHNNCPFYNQYHVIISQMMVFQHGGQHGIKLISIVTMLFFI